ncbi:MAG: NAD-dependent epimerase/dehydratase family protein [Planctomycetales bacterium]|nr:NAD-dependent epimerase/dehydratase family protein [Planctomycetales bacterium]
MDRPNDGPCRRLLIVGCGYVGMRVAERCIATGIHVSALTRSSQRVNELQNVGIAPIVADWNGQLPTLAEFDYVLVSVPHREGENHDGEQTHVHGLARLLGSLPSGWCKLLYLSTTGVYGDCPGQVVDESTEPSPTRLGPRIALAAEDWLIQNVAKEKLAILRLAGIYGPGRLPLISRVIAGEALAVPAAGYVNLVHVEDIARMIMIVFSTRLELSTYVFSDGHPVQRRCFYGHAAQLCQAPAPVFVDPAAGDNSARRATDKRVNPQRLLAETNFVFDYPDYRIGLENLLPS